VVGAIVKDDRRIFDSRNVTTIVLGARSMPLEFHSKLLDKFAVCRVVKVLFAEPLRDIPRAPMWLAATIEAAVANMMKGSISQVKILKSFLVFTKKVFFLL
jgi:hypothetical protein